MFDSSYAYKGLGTTSNISKKHLLKTYKYFFDTEEGERYIINVEQYPYNIFVLKFYPRSLKNSKYKYNVLTKTGHLSKIVRTNIEILINFHNQFPNSHFGFIGARTYCTVQKKYIETGDVTKRFRLYRYAVVNLINPDNFEHHEDEVNNTYLLINSKETKTDIKSLATKIFEDCMN